jgi:hypothetical protein
MRERIGRCVQLLTFVGRNVLLGVADALLSDAARRSRAAYPTSQWLRLLMSDLLHAGLRRSEIKGRPGSARGRRRRCSAVEMARVQAGRMVVVRMMMHSIVVVAVFMRRFPLELNVERGAMEVEVQTLGGYFAAL